MSKRKLLIKVDCGAKTCGKCEWWMDGYDFCFLFNDDADNMKRCPACLRAEKKVKR